MVDSYSRLRGRRVALRVLPVVLSASAIVLPSSREGAHAAQDDSSSTSTPLPRRKGLYSLTAIGPGWGQLLAAGESRWSSGGVAFSMAIGFGPASRRGLGLGLQVIATELHANVARLKLKQPGASDYRHVSAAYGELVVLGAFCDYFPDPDSGWHFGGMAGYGVAAFWGDDRKNVGDTSSVGTGLWGGYAPWLGSSLSADIRISVLVVAPGNLRDGNGAATGDTATAIGFSILGGLLWF